MSKQNLENFFTDNKRNAYAKIGIYGSAGSGKTYTATKLAIGLYKFAKLKKPVLYFDTEQGYGWVKNILEKNNIKSACKVSRTFVDLMDAVDIAKKEGSILIVDSITHVWSELCKAFVDKVNLKRKKLGKPALDRLRFHHWGVIKEEWAKFTLKFLSSNLHMIVCGRAAIDYEYTKDEETGTMEVVNAGTKMKTEKELAYEPSLLIEMVKEKDAKTGFYKNVAIVEKDKSDNHNGRRFTFPNFESFKKHFECLDLSSSQYEFDGNSQDVFEDVDQNGLNEWYREKKQRAIYSEEIQSLLTKYYPGLDKDSKQKKASLLVEFCKTGSWTKISEETSSEELKAAFLKLKNLLEPAADAETEDVPQ